MTVLDRISMRRLLGPACALALAAGLPAGATPAEVAPSLHNASIEGFPAAGFPGTSAGQFGSFAPATAVPDRGTAPGAQPPALPSNGQLRLTRSVLGFAFAGNVPDLFFGDVIPYPLATFPDDQGREIELRRQPVDAADGAFRYRRVDHAEGAPNETFDPAVLDAEYFFSPHARARVSDAPDGLSEELDTAGPRWVDGFAYANGSGSQKVFWRTATPIDFEGSDPVFGLVETSVQVASGTRLPIRRIFWTEETFTGPPVDIPLGEIQQVNIAFTGTFPETVAAEEVVDPPGSNGFEEESGTFITRNTLFHNTVTNTLNAYNREGRVLVEFLGETRNQQGTLRRQVGVEIVDVIREPFSRNVDVPLGERLFPLSPKQPQAYLQPEGDLLQPALVRDGLEELSPVPVLNSQALAQNFTGQFEVDGRIAYYAQKETRSASDVQFFWKEDGVGGVQWPVFLNRYRQFWPEKLSNYAVNLRSSDAGAGPGTLPIFGEGTTVELLHQDDPTSNQAKLRDGVDFQVTLDPSDAVNRSLLLLRSTEGFWFMRVESVHDTAISRDRYAGYYSDRDPGNAANPLVATVGERLTPPAGADSIAGWVDLSQGDAIDPTAYLDPFSAGIDEAEQGAIIPVNAATTKNNRRNDRLGVWWFERFDPPASAGRDLAPIHFPSHFARYQLRWPTDAPQIVLASNAGSGDLSPLAANGTIYTQNDPAEVGYNPNEEHALLLAGRAYALRDDLNFPATTSDAYTLVRHTAADGRPAIDVFRVLRENEQYDFHYPATAGTVLQPPAPLSLMPPPLRDDGTSANLEVTATGTDDADHPDADAAVDYHAFTFEDRKGLKWLYRGPHDPENVDPRPTLGMQFHYQTLEGFAFPDATTGEDGAPELGTIVPFLRPFTNGSDRSGGFDGDAQTGDPLTVRFTPYWPDDPALPAEERREVPELKFAETLVTPKFGLPGLDGASSAEVLYHQSVARDDLRSARLHDPTRQKVYLLNDDLDGIPGSIPTTSQGGRTYLQNLPPHLESNFFLDPTVGSAGALIFQGEFVETIVGEDYLSLNLLGDADLALLKGLVDSEDTDKDAWISALDELATTVETFIEDPDFPGSYIPDSTLDVSFGPGEIAEILASDSAVDSYALTAVGGGEGYVVLVLGNGEAFSDPGEPVQMHVLRVGGGLYPGDLRPLTADNPLTEQVSLRHSGDFGGRAEDYEFQWYYSPPVDGQPPLNRPGEAGPTWFRYGDDDAGPLISFGGTQPLLSLADNYFVMRYRPKDDKVPASLAGLPRDEQWSPWTDVALAEGWIKRVLAGINPFNQRISDFFNNAINTDVSLLTQAGTRWEGDVPLTLDSAASAGLIEIYETLLRRGESFTIDGSPAVDYGPANDALLLAAGYLNDLYLALGNEAFADASNPLIALDVDPSRILQQQGLPASIGTTIQNTATARFAFEGQVASLLDEELTLLRGRDDFLVPGARKSPVYNRFFWNYTRGIDSGEVIYALNYNIHDKSSEDAIGSTDGVIDAADAAYQFPQGHGDAYGHYLTAVTNYYRLLSDDEFTWTPRVEAVNILGAPVTVDYQDERRLAAAAAALGRTASRIIDLERRKLPSSTREGWSRLREHRRNSTSGITRTWGAEQWASRAGQGNYLHWVTANALLPEVDTEHEGLQKIDRQSVPELAEMAAIGRQIQEQLDAANQRTNALGLTDNSVLFDLSPAEIAAGNSHFDQILARAKAALANAAKAHERTIETNNLLRSVENQADDYSFTVAQEEFGLENQLYDIYGMAYPGHTGPGRTYPQGYLGPDFLNFMYIDRPYVYSRDRLFSDPDGSDDGTFHFDLPIYSSSYVELIAGFDKTSGKAKEIADGFKNLSTLSYTLNLNDGPYQIAADSLGTRPFLGETQRTLAQVMAAEEALYVKLNSLKLAKEGFERTAKRFADDIDAENKIVDHQRVMATVRLGVEKTIGGLDLVMNTLTAGKETSQKIAGTIKESIPTNVGISTDAMAPARGAVLAATLTAETGMTIGKKVAETGKYLAQLGLDIAELANSEFIREFERDTAKRAAIAELRSAYGDVFADFREVDAANIEYQRALEAYQNALVDGETILAQRESFRKRAAAVIQGARVRDVAFRAFRTESLEQYKTLFDQAARYIWLAAKAYDYETGLLGTPAGEEFFASIAASRALGLVGEDGEPQFAASNAGDPGLSSLLARLEQDWNVAKGRLGVNNPDQYGTLLSLRRELFNLPYRGDGNDDHQAWQDALLGSLVGDLRADPDIAAHALAAQDGQDLPIPGFVIPFSSTIESGKNFFGRPLVGGDSAFSSASFATRVASVGVVLEGYQGMDPFATGNRDGAVTHDGPNALSATPYVYLLPAGTERMRVPGSAGEIREWNVHDHAMPLPYDIGGGAFDERAVWTAGASLQEPFYQPRRHAPFRAVDDPTLFYGSVPREFTNSRLIGRSVWNDRWKLVIPAPTLLAEPEQGIERFVDSVRDIKLFLRTYSHSGN